MYIKPVRILTALVLLFLSGTVPLLAQATFSVASGPVTAADIGYAEPTGSITLVVSSGTTTAAPFVFTYSSAIANKAASEITVTGTGGLSGIAAHPTFVDSRSLRIDVPAGGNAGDMIVIYGVRTALAGTNAKSVTVTVLNSSGGGNLIEAGQMNPVVIGSIVEPISVTQGSPLLSYAYGKIGEDSSYVEISEAYSNAFTDSVGVGGQTTPTIIRITPFPSLPPGTKITFDSIATASTGAKFTTLSGNDETVPRADGSTDVVFQFTSAPGSSALIEPFRFHVSLTQAPDAALGEIQFQATLLPLGAESAEVPRYVERLVPDESELSTGFTELVFPFRAKQEGTYTGVALTNPQEFRALATLTAYGSDGSRVTGKDVINPVTVTLPRNGQYAKLASEIFGSGFDASSGTIRVAASANIEGFYILGDISGPKFDGSTADVASSYVAYMPVLFREGSNSYNLLEAYNPSESQTTVNFQLLNAKGVVAARGSETVAAGGMALKDAREVFGVDPSSLEGGYIKAQSQEYFMLRNNFGNDLESNVLMAHFPSSTRMFYIPHFATGGQYSTAIDLVNSNTQITAQITMTLLDDSGNPISVPENPATFSIAPQAKVSRTIAALFPSLGANLTTGSIRVDVGPEFNPFLVGPGIAGAVRYYGTDGSASATLPIVPAPSTDCVYSHVAEGSGYYTGVALQNPNDTPAGFTLDVYAKDGSLVGSYNSTLQAHAKIARMISQLIPAAAGQVGGYFRIRSDARLTSLALFGTTDLRSLSVIAPQILK